MQVELPSDPMQLYIDYHEAMMDRSLTMFSNVPHAAQYPIGPTDFSELDEDTAFVGSQPKQGGLSQALSMRVGTPGSRMITSTSHLTLGGESNNISKVTSNASLADCEGNSRPIVGVDYPIPRIWKEVSSVHTF